jgi:hypothetical protein
MSFAVIQNLVVGVIVFACALSALRHFAPRVCANVQRRTALWLVRDAHPAWMRRLALRVQPAANAGGRCASSGACNGCGSPVQRKSPLSRTG